MIIWHFYRGEYYYERLRWETLFMLSSSLVNTIIHFRGGQLLHCRTQLLTRSFVPRSAMLVLTASHKIYNYIYWSGLQHRMGKVRSLWLPTSWIEIEYPHRSCWMQNTLTRIFYFDMGWTIFGLYGLFGLYVFTNSFCGGYNDDTVECYYGFVVYLSGALVWGYQFHAP